VNDPGEKETRTARVRLDPEGFVCVFLHPGAEVELDDALEITEAGTELIEGKKRPFLTDIREIGSISREARNHFSGTEAAENCLATAVLVGSPLSHVIGSFFLGLNKPPFPVKLFSSEDGARKWLRQFLR
jgi:hypothetical protein